MSTIRTNIDTTTNRDLLKEGTLREIFDTTQREVKVEYPILVNDKTTKLMIETDQRMAGLGLAVSITEGQDVPLATPILGGQKTYTQKIWALGFRMTYFMDFFNKYNLWKRWSADLARKQKESKDIEIAAMFISPTTSLTTPGLGFDGQVLAYDTHTGLISGATDNYDNKYSGDLSYSSLEAARNYFETLIDDRGLWAGATMTHLVYHPNLEFTAQELFKSEFKPWENSNTINVLREMDLKLVPYHRLASTTMWFALAKDAMYDINVFTAKEPDFITQDAPDTTRDRLATSMQFFIYGWGDPRRYFYGQA